MLYPIILVICILGVYTMRTTLEDILLLAVFGMLGYVLMALKINFVPFMIGFVLGPKFEIVFRRSLVLNDGNFSIFVDRPISLALLCICVILVLIGINKYIRNFRS